MDITSYLLGKQAGGGSGVDLNDYLNLELKTNPAGTGDNFYTRLLKNKQPLKPTVASTVTNIDYAFYNYAGDLDMSDFDFTNITSAVQLFGSFKGSTVIFNNNEIPLSGINSWFASSSITSIDLKIKTTSLTVSNGFYSMFENCTNLVSVDFSNFDISENESESLNVRRLFRYDSNLENITFGDFSKFTPAKIGRRDDMFTGCTKLTNTSLNNILNMCSRIPTDGYGRTLSGLGLTQEQATTCTGLSNWAAAQAAGWTTGY